MSKWSTVLAVDINEPAIRAYRENFPSVDARVADVRGYPFKRGMASLVAGGFPCQPHSLAGKRKASGDERDCGPDFVEAIRIIQPRHFLGENVPGILTSENDKYAQRLVASMMDAGYVVQHKTLDCVNWGVPQFRRRTWFWGIRKDLYRNGMRHVWPEPTHQWPPPDGCLFGKALSPGVTVGKALELEGMIVRSRGETQKRREHPTGEPCPTVGAGCQGSGSRLSIKTHRGPEWAKLEAERTIDEPSPAVTAGSRSGGHDGLYLQMESGSKCRKDGSGEPRGPLVKDLDNPAFTIDSTPGSLRVVGGGSNPHFVGEARTERDITDEPSTTISASHLHNALPEFQMRLQPHGGNAGGPFDPNTPAPTMRNCLPGCTFHPITEPIGTIGSGEWKGGKAAHFIVAPAAFGPGSWKLRDGMWTRRLSVLECARLQSVPDDYRWPDGVSKTNAYRIIGNGQACEQSRVLGEAIRTVDPECMTAVSLFCGGGLGDCGFEGRAWRYDPSGKAALSA
jgi:site-specific DNA-cytosine methylase